MADRTTFQDPRDMRYLNSSAPLVVGLGHAATAPRADAARAQDERRAGFRGVGARNYQRSDHAVLDDVHEALKADDELDASGIDVHVQDGVVTLAGSVRSRYDKKLAALLADGVRGVKDVMNELYLTPAQH